MLRRFRCVQIFLKQYNIGEKPIVMLYAYINRHAGTPDTMKQSHLNVLTFSPPTAGCSEGLGAF